MNLSEDLTKDFKTTVKTAIGQLNAVLKLMEQDKTKPETVFNQLKASEALVIKSKLMLLDEVYRKAMAEKISYAYENCTGNCGNENEIEKLREMFPNIPLEEVPQRLDEAIEVAQKLKEILSGKDLHTPIV